MTDAIDEADTRARAIAAFQLHKSIGLTVLVLSLMRLLWRLTHKPPSLPAGMALWDRKVRLGRSRWIGMDEGRRRRVCADDGDELFF